jgi:hypothetical protein
MLTLLPAPQTLDLVALQTDMNPDCGCRTLVRHLRVLSPVRAGLEAHPFPLPPPGARPPVDGGERAA